MGIRHIGDHRVGFLLDAEHLARIFDIDSALRGQRPVGFVTYEERSAELLLELLKLLREGGLGDEELLGSTGDGALIGDFNDIFDLFCIHKS